MENGVVANIIEVDNLGVFPGLVDATGASIGFLWDGSAFSAPTPPTPTVEQYVAAVQNLLDTTARQRNYDGILSACTYATSTNAKFQAEGQACVAWRDGCWAYCYQALADVDSGKRTAPTIDGLIAELPTLTWPA
jgi:hypothetical protein